MKILEYAFVFRCELFTLGFWGQQRLVLPLRRATVCSAVCVLRKSSSTLGSHKWSQMKCAPAWPCLCEGKKTVLLSVNTAQCVERGIWPAMIVQQMHITLMFSRDKLVHCIFGLASIQIEPYWLFKNCQTQSNVQFLFLFFLVICTAFLWCYFY